MLTPTNYEKNLCSLMRGPSEWLSDIWDTKGCSLFTMGGFPNGSFTVQSNLRDTGTSLNRAHLLVKSQAKYVLI